MSLPGLLLDPPPANDGIASQGVERAAAYVGPLLAGLGLVMWLAANWDGFGRYGRFGVVAAALIISVGGALAIRRARPGFLLLAFLSAGGLFALIGQTYQTGADPWSLFAIWAALTLPFALAARSDAVWCGWIIVALAAVTLWAHNAGGGLFDERLGKGIVLTTWGLALALCALLSPWSPLRRLTGSAAWTWRIGLWLTASQISLLASAAVTIGNDTAIYLGGLLLLGGIATLILVGRPFDILAAAIVGLAIDIALIVGIARLLYSVRSDGIAASLVVGLCSAAIVAGTGAVLVKRLRAERTAEGATSSADDDAPWPVVAMTAFGALIAAIPLLVFYGLFIALIAGEKFFDRGPLMYIFGAGTLGVAILMLPKKSLGRFAEIFALIFAVVGMLQIGFALFRDLPPGAAAALLALACAGLAAILPQRWIAVLLGAATGILASFALVLSIVGYSGLPVLGMLTGMASRAVAWRLPALQVAECAMVLAVVAAFLFRGGHIGRLQSFLTGWIASLLLNQAAKSGQTFLLGAFSGLPNREVTLIGSIPYHLRIAPLLLAAVGIGLLFRAKPGFRTPLLLGGAAIALVLTVLQPLFGPVVFIGAVMLAADRRRLALLAGLTALWIIGAWYYAVTLPLTQKGLILMVLGAILGGLALVARRRVAEPTVASASISSGHPALGAALIAIGGLAIAGLAGWSIWDKERVLRDGRMVMLRIVPVDPRSLMQGDYMTLAFELPERRASATSRQPGGPQPVAVGTIGPDNVVKMTEIVLKRPALANDQIAIALSVKNGAYVVGSDAWFFREGEARRFAGARYGIFRVTLDGTALLAGLADEQRQPIR
jgi:uncharacterized membrane-anchored protein/uncharacterized membrane protein